jgi:CDP-diacylglycerol pyrophosphatase
MHIAVGLKSQLAGGALSLALSLVVGISAHAADPDALWKITHDRCVPDQTQHDDPAPCAKVDLSQGEAKGYVVLKDIVGATQFLLIPTARISGIESPEILAPDTTNYFAAAWRARSFMEERIGHPVPRDWVSLAINSSLGRTQNQLHIHIDCISIDVHDLLRQHMSEVSMNWAPFPVPLAGHRYSAIAVAGGDLDDTNPFLLLANGEEDARADMGYETLVVVGATLADGRPGFIMLADRANLAVGNRASGEELQDHGCKIAQS